MPTIVATTVVTLEAIDVAVFVTTFCTPPMSFEIRDCTSPVRVRVKKASDSRCRWRKTAARRSCITRWPTWFESSVWRTPRMPGRDGDRDHPAGVERERTRVVALDRLEDVLEQEGRDDAERGRDDDQPEDAAEPGLVVPEQAADAAQVRPPHGRIGGTLGRRAGGMEEHAHRPRVRREARSKPCTSRFASSPGCASARAARPSSSTASSGPATSGPRSASATSRRASSTPSTASTRSDAESCATATRSR